MSFSDLGRFLVVSNKIVSNVVFPDAISVHITGSKEGRNYLNCR